MPDPTPLQALQQYLAADATLAGLAPAGVHIDVAPQGTVGTRVLVSVINAPTGRGCAGRMNVDVALSAAVWVAGLAEDLDAVTEAWWRLRDLLTTRWTPASSRWAVGKSNVTNYREPVRLDGDVRWHAVGWTAEVGFQEQ